MILAGLCGSFLCWNIHLLPSFRRPGVILSASIQAFSVPPINVVSLLHSSRSISSRSNLCAMYWPGPQKSYWTPSELKHLACSRCSFGFCSSSSSCGNQGYVMQFSGITGRAVTRLWFLQTSPPPGLNLLFLRGRWWKQCTVSGITADRQPLWLYLVLLYLLLYILNTAAAAFLVLPRTFLDLGVDQRCHT